MAKLSHAEVVAMLLVTASVAIVSIVISAITLASLDNPDVYIHQTGTSGEPAGTSVVGIDQHGNRHIVAARGKIYLLAVGHDAGAHEYYDREGYLQGFNLMISNLVCQEAGVDCRLVWNRYQDCWESHSGQHPNGGRALHGKWVDACIGWFNTHERLQVFDVSQSFTENNEAFFFYKPGSNFNSEDISGKVIGFLEGWATDDMCLSKQHQIQGSPAATVYSVTKKEALARLMANQIDALLIFEKSMIKYVKQGLLSYDRHMPIRCTLAGESVMSRKDSDFIEIWNTGFNKARANGQFAALCEEASIKHEHKGTINCIHT